MYCSTCGTQTTPGLSYCNRCGANLKTRNDSAPNATIAAYLTTITIVALAGLGIMFAGSLVLRNEAHFGGEIIGPFMVMTFLVVMMIEIYLCRQLSRLTMGSDKNAANVPHQIAPLQNELGAEHQRALPEPLPSVTENTTRTLEYSYHEPQRR